MRRNDVLVDSSFFERFIGTILKGFSQSEKSCYELVTHNSKSLPSSFLFLGRLFLFT